MKITGRSSSITNAFINSIIPTIPPTEDQVKKALLILEMTPEDFNCSYCGAKVTEWDHLRPLVKNKKPTGYISEIYNLVPSCGKCNQSKGNKDWHQWMLSDATLSPKSKGIPGLEIRIARLKAYENWHAPTKLDFEPIVGKEVWERHWDNWEEVLDRMKKSQELAEQIKLRVTQAYGRNR